MQRGPSWREIGALVSTIVLFTAGGLAYAFTTFANKTDMNSRLDRIESKLDCLIDPKICR